MILIKENDKLLLLTDVENEDDFIEMNSNALKVDNLPYSISNVYTWHPDFPEDISHIISDEASDIEELKIQKLDEVYNKFDDLMTNGTFTSSLGFEVDNRRGGGKDDKDNVSSLIDLGAETVYFRDANNNFHELTTDDLIILKQEMIQDGLGKYQWKWDKENEIMSAETLDALDSIEI